MTTYYTTDSRISGHWEGVNNQIGNEYILGASLNDLKKGLFIRTAGEDLILETTQDAITFFKKCDLKYKTLTIEKEKEN